MKKHHRDRMLVSTCLTGLALALASGAQAQDGEATWQPRAEVDARAGDGNSQVSLELFAPLTQNDSGLLFAAGRIGTDELFHRNGSVTMGGRVKVGSDAAIGVNAGVDFYKSDLTSRAQAATSFGLEGFTSVFDLHVNYRLPLNDSRTIGFADPAAAAVGALSVENNRLIETFRGFRLEEVPLAGVNGELGARVPLDRNLSVRASLGGFDYRDRHADQSYHGGRGGLEIDIEDPVSLGGRFSFGAELQDDNRWGTQARGMVRLSIPLGRGSRDRGMGTGGLDRQMGDRVRRAYFTPAGSRYTDLTSTSFAIDNRTGQAFGGIYYTSGAATTSAAGTSASPTTLGDAVSRAGANGVVVLLGNAGNITSSGVTLATNQYLVGGASSVDVRHANGSVTAFGFGGTNGAIVGTNASGAAVTLGQGSVMRDVTVRGAGSGILADSVGAFALERVTIENTGGAGLTLNNTIGSVVIDGITIRGGGGTGLVVNGGSNVTLRNSVIGGGAGAIDIKDAGNNLTATLSGLTLSATGGTVLDIDGSGAGTVTVAGLSNLTIAGGNGEIGGFAARGVTFDASTVSGIQSVDAGTMQVGTTAARVGSAGVTLTDVDGALSFTALNIANTGGTGLTVDNTKSGTFTLSNAAGTVDTTAGAALNLDPLAIDLNFTSVGSIGATGPAVLLDTVQGAGAGGNALTIGTLTVTGSGAQGLYITGGSTGQVTIGAGTITDSGGASVQVGEAGVAGSGGTVGLTFGGAVSDTGAGPLVSIFNAGGAICFTGALSGAGPITVADTLAGSSVTFASSVTITGAASPAVSLNNLAGSTAFSGPLTIVNPVGTGVKIGSVPGGVTFGDVDITGLGAATGLDLTRAQGNVTFATLDISGTGAAGSTGIDLSDATNSGAVTITNSSVIQGVDIGANLTNADITGSFRYGDANAANGLGSRISANTVAGIAGMNASHGVYDFSDVQLDGDASNITGGSFTSYYVLAGANGVGTMNDPGSIGGAAASGAQYIVLLNNPAGGQNVIDTAGLSGGALSLTTGQSLLSFLNTDFFAVTGSSVPANLIVSNLGDTGITNPFAGSGAAVLTSSTGFATVNLASDARVDGAIIRNDALGVGITGSGVSNVIVRNSNVSGNGGAISITDGGSAASATLTNLDLSASGGTVLNLSGAGAGTLNVSGTGINVTATGSAQGLVLDDVTVGTLAIGSVSTETAGGPTAVQVSQVRGGAVNIDSVTLGGMGRTSAGVGLSVTDNSATVNISAVSAANTAGVGVAVSDNIGNVTLGSVGVSGTGSDGVRITGNSGTVAIGTLTSNNAGGAGLRVSNMAGNLTVGASTIANSAGVGLVLEGIGGTATFGTTTIANSAGILFGAGTTGAITFGDTDIAGLAANTSGVDARAGAGNVSFVTLDISGASASGTRGIDLAGATFTGSFTVSGSSSITGVGTGVDLTNAAITGSFQYGDGSNTDADGAHSTISALTPIAVSGLNQTVGTYNFADVVLSGDITGLATNPVTFFFVEQGRTGSGTKTDPGSLAAALGSSATAIVLLNNPVGGSDTLDVSALGTFTLDANQRLIGFLNGDTQTVGGGTPVNLSLYGIAPGIVTNPYSGSGSGLLTNTGLGATVTLSNGSSIDGVRIGGNGIGVSGIGVSNVSIGNSIISGDAGAILLRDGGMAGSATLTNLALSGTGGTVLNLLGTGGGTLALNGSGISIAATGNARGLAMDTVTLGTGLGFTAVSTLTSAGSGVSLANNLGTGEISFTSIDVGGSAAAAGVRVGGNSAAINLGNVTVANADGDGIEVVNNPGNVTLGTFDISNTAASGLLVSGMPGTFIAASGTVTNSAAIAIDIGDVDGSVTFSGPLTITNPGTAGIAFNTGSTGTIGFGDVDINGLAASTTGVDARLASGTITFDTLDIIGASATGTRGIDMTGATFGGSLIVSHNSSIAGVGTGVDLTNAGITGRLQFGDGSITDANGAASTINATNPILIGGMNAVTGTYNFADVNLTGDTSNLSASATVYWVLAGASGTGMRGDPGSLTGAAASGADIIILLNNPAGGNDTLDVNDPTYGTGGTFTLMTGQQLRGFLNGDTISLPGGAPANVLLYNITQGSVTNPFTGSAAPTLTSTTAGTDTVRVSGNNLIDGVRITSAGTGVYGSAAANVTIRNSIMSGADSAIELTSGGGAASAALSNLVLTATGGSIPLALYVAGGGSMAVTQLSNITINQGAGSQGAYLMGATFDANPATAGYQAVDASMTFGSAVNRLSGAAVNLTNALGALNFTSLSIFNQDGTGVLTSGTGLTLTSAAGAIDTLNGTNISLNGTQANLVLDNLIHAGTGTGVTATGLTGIGTAGQALAVTNFQSTGGSNAILFTGTNNGAVSFGAGSNITGTSGAAIDLSSGTGTLDLTYGGSITQANNAALLAVSNHNGTITFGAGSTLSATNGTGLQFDNADGTYNFNGTTTLNGGSAGIAITNGSGGSFTFGSGTSIISPTGTALGIANSTASLLYSGNITQANGAALFNVLNHAGGTITFQNGTLSATNGTGLQFDNADGTYNFTGTTTLNGGDAGVGIVNGSAGTFGFGTGTSITHAGVGDAFVMSGSDAALLFSGSIDDSNGYAVNIDAHNAGTATFDTGTIAANGADATGIILSNNAGGSINFNGQVALNTQANNALTLTGNAGSTVAFNAGGNGLDIVTTSGTGLLISGGGTINVLGANNSITTGSGVILDVANAAAAATTLNLNFASASNTAGANGILVSRTLGTLTGSMNIAGGGIVASTRGVSLDGDALAFTYAGTIATTGTTGRSVEVTDRTANTATFSGNITDTALGINVSNNSGGTVSFTGQSIALTTVSNAAALTLANNTGAALLFGPAGGGNGLDIVASGPGTGISYTGGGTLSIYGTGNTVQTATGQILNLVNGNVGAAGLNFDALMSTGTVAATAIMINNLDGSTLNGGTVTIAGTSGAGSDGIFYGGGSTTNMNFGSTTIANTSDEGIEINGAGNGSFTASSVTIDNTGGNGVEINGSTNLVSLAGGAIGATNDPTGFGVYVLNGTGAITISSSVAKTTVGNAVFVDNHEVGNVTFSANISGTGGVNNGIVVQNVNSGTIQFSGSVLLSTGANAAVNLLNNTGGTISFPNGSLSITTASGTGFSATGGGNVDVQGTNSTITSGTGTALNVVNTYIGANGLNFRSISSNGASSGINLNNTGSAGGLRVVGTGVAGSGGTIQNSSGDGISLTSTENVRLAYMNVANNLGDGIGGSYINGFIIDNLLISGNGNDNSTDESGINISELTGTGSGGTRPTGIFNSTIQNNNEFEVQIANSTGTLTNFQIVNSNFASNGNAVNGNATPGHGNLVNFLGTGSSSMGLTVTGSTFTGNWNPSSPPTVIIGSGLFIDSSGTNMAPNISTSNFYNLNNGINVSTGPGSTTLTYSIIGNTITGSRSTAINDFHNGNAPFTRTVNGTIQNNIIGTNGAAMSGSQLGNGISIANEGSVYANYLISGNTIQQVGAAGTSGSSAIAVNVGLVGQATFGGTTNITIQNNTIRDILNSRGVVVNNNQNTGTLASVRLSLSGNQFLGTIAGQAGNGQYIRLSDSGGGPFFVTQAAATSGAIASELDDSNGFNDTSKISIGTGTFTYGAPAPALPPAVVPLP